MRDHGDGNNGKGDNTGSGIVTRTRTKTKKPSLYKVLLLNDDYTPMEFVVHILEKFFAKSREDAVEVGSSRVDLQACKLEYSIVSPK